MIYKDISEGERIPKGYGIAWRYYGCMKTRCYPIPLNLIIRSIRTIYFSIMAGVWHSKWENELREAYGQGFFDGKKSGITGNT
jgi:hypothetical protein